LQEVYGIDASIDEIEARLPPTPKQRRQRVGPTPLGGRCGCVCATCALGADAPALSPPSPAQHHGSTDLLVTLATMQHRGACSEEQRAHARPYSRGHAR
jgi:hypothetical protein